MQTVTESIYSGKNVIVPLADVQHIETDNSLGLVVVTKHTKWDHEVDSWANAIWIDGAEAVAFKAAWCRYRSELEAAVAAAYQRGHDIGRQIGWAEHRAYMKKLLMPETVNKI
jgi:hypothetical protein